MTRTRMSSNDLANSILVRKILSLPPATSNMSITLIICIVAIEAVTFDAICREVSNSIVKRVQCSSIVCRSSHISESRHEPHILSVLRCSIGLWCAYAKVTGTFSTQNCNLFKRTLNHKCMHVLNTQKIDSVFHPAVHLRKPRRQHRLCSTWTYSICTIDMQQLRSDAPLGTRSP